MGYRPQQQQHTRMMAKGTGVGGQQRHMGVLLILLQLTVVFLTLAPNPVSSQGNQIVFKLMEEQPTDTFIGNVASRSGIENDVTPEVFRRLRYQILSSDGLRISSLFTINSVTGALFTNAMINRERVCDSTTTACSLEFDVTVTSNVTVIRLLNVMVEIQDKNDNAPSFQSRHLPLSVSEASPLNSEMSISGAIDLDTGLDTVITYWMDDSEIFGLREEKLLDVSLLKIVLKQKLDREVESSYQLLIYAKDGNTSSALTGTLTVDVTVTDVNDHDPDFVQDVYNFTAKENLNPDDVVGKIQAIDLDAGDNGEIVYSFSSLTSAKVLQLFSLNSTSGEITVKSGLEYESNKRFQAVVEAKDKGGSPRASQAVLILNIVDAGNTPPRLSLTLADQHSQGTTMLSEDTAVGSFVGTLKYLDIDEGDNGVVECVSLNRHFILQSLENVGYGIEIKSKLDREADNEIKVMLRCSDRGQPSLSSFVNFTVYVSDVNDNSPVFLESEYTVPVSEGQSTVPNILRVSASDRDEGKNSEIMYQLTANSSNSFSINPFTGWISLVDMVDRESGPSLRLTVLGIDKGKNPKTGSVLVNVNIEDINDNAPEIIRSDYSCRENSKPGSYVSRIVATDKDIGLNGEVAFSLISDPTNSFAVSREGVITTKKELDREAVPFYFIAVLAQDKGIPTMSSTATLTLTVMDGNDHKPVVIFPTPSNDTVTISANLSPGSFVAKAKAEDEDIDKNGKLMYLIVEGNHHKVFSIDNSTGTVYVSQRLTNHRDTFYRLTILIQDGGTPRMYTEAYLKVRIDFTNATMLDAGSDMEQKYVIIAGIISGITIVIAIIVIAIIFKLRQQETRMNLPPSRKSKESSHLNDMGKTRSEIPAHNVALGFKLDPHLADDKEAGFDPERGCSGDHDPNISFDSHLGNGSVTFTQRSAMTQDYINKHSCQHFHPYTEGRQPLPSEDIRSDTSGETTTSDSGRGASDVEDSGVSSSHTFQAKPVLLTKHAPQVPPRQPLQMSQTTPIATSSAPNIMSPTELPTQQQQQQRGLSTFGDLSRAERAYASHKYFDNKPKKVPGKVRFSFDDQSIVDDPSSRRLNLNSHVVHFQPVPQNQQYQQQQQQQQNPISTTSTTTPMTSSIKNYSKSSKNILPPPPLPPYGATITTTTTSAAPPQKPSRSTSESNDLSQQHQKHPRFTRASTPSDNNNMMIFGSNNSVQTQNIINSDSSSSSPSSSSSSSSFPHTKQQYSQRHNNSNSNNSLSGDSHTHHDNNYRHQQPNQSLNSSSSISSNMMQYSNTGGNHSSNNNNNNSNNFRNKSSFGGGVPLNQLEDALARQNLNSKRQSGHSSNSNNNYSSSSKNVSYPLLRPPKSSLPLNMSVDEDDDDGGSTTTSGSYAIDDQLNVSVEC